MRQRSTSLHKFLCGIPDTMGLDFAVETIRRANDVSLSLPTFWISSALLANRRAIGASCPISSILARRHHCRPGMLPCDDGLFLEISDGSGMMTTALLRRGVDPEKLTVVEQGRPLAQHLKDRFPNVAVVHGNTVKLCQLYNRYGRHVGTMVPSLPLLSLPSCRVGSPWQRFAEDAGRQWLIHSVHLSTQ